MSMGSLYFLPVLCMQYISYTVTNDKVELTDVSEANLPVTSVQMYRL